VARGGQRDGAGRHPTPSILKKEAVCVKLPRWLNAWTAQQEESRAVLIERALEAQYGLKSPTIKSNQ